MRVVDILLLSYRKEPAVAVQGLLYRLDRTGAPGRYRYGHAWIYDSIAKW